MTDINSELEKAKRRIRALVEKTVDRGASEAEAMLAMKKVGELLLQYNLSMDEIALREEPCVTKVLFTDSKKRDVSWYLYSGLSKLCGVRVWYERTHAGINWHFFGLESDVDMAIYLSQIVRAAEGNATNAFKKTPTYAEYFGDKKIATNNFRIGFGTRMNDRLLALARERQEEEKKAHEFHRETMAARGLEASEEAYKARGTALICLAKEKRVEEEFKMKGPKLRTVRTTTRARYASGAYDAGKSAANNVNLNRPVGGGNKASGYLT